MPRLPTVCTPAATLLEQLREASGADNNLPLENGQDWNGSGLTYLTLGDSGVQGSHLLGCDALVSSDERVLWSPRCARHYLSFAQPVLGAGAGTRAGRETVWVLRRGSVRVALVGVIDPYAQDQEASLKQWYQALLPVVEQARREADLVVARRRHRHRPRPLAG